MNTTTYFFLTLSAPLHIGCGEVYEPMGFVVDPDALELVSFNPADFLANLSSDELAQYSAICRRGTVDSIQDLYKFMRQHWEHAQGVRIGISKNFSDHYAEVLDKPKQRFSREMNQFEISRTSYSPIENTPVIPGSSIKGAIRTAVLNNRNKGASLKQFRGRRASQELQEHLLQYSLKNIATDPFRLVKISDFMPVGEVMRSIIYVVDVKKKPSDKEPAAVYQMLEIIEPGARFFGSITVLPAPRDIRKPVSLEEISTSLKQFYGFEKKREDQELEGINIKSVDFAGGDNDLPLRLGRHSGAECVTINGHRNIKIMQGPGNPPKFKKHATTIWLAADQRKMNNNSGLRPMGWTELSPLNKNQIAEINKHREEQLKKQKEQRKEEMEILVRQETERKIQAREAEELRIRQEIEEAERHANVAEKENNWQNMSEEEKDLAIICGDEIAKLQAQDIDLLQTVWPKITGAAPEHQKAMAQAFKALWKSEGKWNVKKKQKKQYEKVNKVKAILGEA